MTPPRPRRWKNRRPEIDHEAERYYIYRLYGADGLLYIGRSCNPLARLKTHHTATDWASGVVQIEGHGPYTWTEAVDREREEIRRHRPPHNIDGVLKNTGGIPLVKAS